MRDRAIELVLTHNRLNQSVEIVKLLLEGRTTKEIREVLDVSQPQISKIKNKYITNKNL